jgi:hypothetical protein
MPDPDEKLTPADPDELAEALAFALKFEGRKRQPMTAPSPIRWTWKLRSVTIEAKRTSLSPAGPIAAVWIYFP